MKTVHQRSLQMEEEFLTAIEDTDFLSDPTSLDVFHQSLTHFQCDISEKTKGPDETTAGVVARIGELSKLLIDMQTESTSFISGMTAELDAVFPVRQSKQHRRHPRAQQSPPCIGSDENRNLDVSRYQPYVKSAYSWLLNNLHDPYPSNKVKNSISQSTNASPKHVSAWFANARREIGWTAISRNFFVNSRSQTVDAAYRALVKEDPERPLDPDILREFVALRASANTLYPEKIRESVTAGCTNNDPMDERSLEPSPIVAPEETDHKQHREKGMDAADREDTDEDMIRCSQPHAKSSYPSSDRSSSSLAEPCLPRGNDHFVPHGPRGRKRRVSLSSTSSDFESDFPETPPNRPTKRLCTNDISKDPIIPMIVPSSPQPSLLECASVFDHAASTHMTGESPSVVIPFDVSPVRTRKRRLSEADSQPVIKRPRTLAVGPRLHAVSNPLPMPGNSTEAIDLDSWFREYFNIPDPVIAEDLDPSTLGEVELFKDWSSLGNPTGFTDEITNAVPAQEVELPCSELQSAAEYFGLTSFPSFFPTSEESPDQTTSLAPSHFGEDLPLLVQNDLSTSPMPHTTAVASLAVPTSSGGHSIDLGAINGTNSKSNLDSLSSQFPDVESFYDVLTATSSVPDSSLGVAAEACNPPLPDTSPLPTSFQSFFDELISQGHPDIDSSHLLMPTPSPSATISHRDYLLALEERQAKLEMLHKYQEEVRRLEAELAL